MLHDMTGRPIAVGDTVAYSLITNNVLLIGVVKETGSTESREYRTHYATSAVQAGQMRANGWEERGPFGHATYPIVFRERTTVDAVTIRVVAGTTTRKEIIIQAPESVLVLSGRDDLDYGTDATAGAEVRASRPA